MAKNEAKKSDASTALAIPGMGISEEQETALTKKSGDFLAIVQLMQSQSDAVKKNDPEGIRGGEFLLGRQTRLKEFKAIVGISRPHAVLLEDNKVTIESYDSDSKEWGQIVDAKKAKKQGARYGIEFLLWLPEFKQFAIFGFMNTARDEAKGAIAARKAKQLATFGSRLVETKNFSWFVPTVKHGPTNEALALPDEDQGNRAAEMFERYKLEKPVQTPEGARPR